MLTKIINWLIKQLKGNTDGVSDGYHTFGELYDHRIALFRVVCASCDFGVWKSKLHHDGTSFPGWFIAGIGTHKGEQISYHIPMKYWHFWPAQVVKKAPEWDGHTPADVVERLRTLE